MPGQPSTQNRSRRQALRSALSWLTCAAVLLFCGGCQIEPDPLSTGYGRYRGRKYIDSVNGTLVFKGIVENRGPIVNRYDKLSPKINNYQSIVWFPNDRAAPPEEVINRLEKWLSDGWERNLIIVGRDYDAEIEYWQDRLSATDDENEKQRFRREIAAAVTQQDRLRNNQEISFNTLTGTTSGGEKDCVWFETKEFGDRQAQKLSGDWINEDATRQANVSYNALLQPPKNVTNEYDYQELMRVDDKTFAYSLAKPEWDGGQIIVVSNASFLLNYPLVNEDNRVLADKLVDPIVYDDRTLFLESDAAIPVRSSDYDAHNQWSWITKPPLRYIVPHFLFWGVLFSFVYFPIFGRARKIKRRSTTNFRDHVAATGRLLERTKSVEEAQSWIEKYRQRNAHELSRKHRE